MAAALPLALDVATLERVVLRPEAGFTDDDLFDFCQHNQLLRIERNSEGELIIMAPVGTESSFAEVEIASQLNAWARQDGRGIVLSATAGLTFPDGSVLSPDACWIPIEKWTAVPRNLRRKFAPLLPAFVIEVRSPSDRKKDLHEKMLTYLRNGVELGWLIDPDSRTADIYKLDQERAVELLNPDTISGDGPVAGFVLDLKQIYEQLG